MAVTLQLGDFVFQREEIPESISFGGEQALTVHRLVGGARVIDAMGRDDDPLEWSGLLYHNDALARARYLDDLRVSGNPLVLSWHELQFLVLIQSFKPKYEKFYQIPYSISCKVVQDLTTPIKTIPVESIDEVVRADLAEASGIGKIIKDSELTAVLGTLDTAIQAVSSIAKATQETINTILVPISAVNARVAILVASVGNTVTNVTTLGGILPNNPIAQQAAGLLNQVTAMTQLPQLYALQSVLRRMGVNLGSVGAASRTVTTAGGNLYSIAAKEYQDASDWTTLARANKLFDPQLIGINEIKVPAVPGKTGGILSL